MKFCSINIILNSFNKFHKIIAIILFATIKDFFNKYMTNIELHLRFQLNDNFDLLFICVNTLYSS